MPGNGLEIPGNERGSGIQVGTQQTAQALPKDGIGRHAFQCIPLERFGAGGRYAHARDGMPCLHEQAPVRICQDPSSQPKPPHIANAPPPCGVRTQFFLCAQDALKRSRRIAINCGADGGQAAPEFAERNGHAVIGFAGGA